MNPLTEDTLRFIREHRTDDVRTLALQAARYPEADVPAALMQIAGWQACREKVPSWAATEGIRYPVHLSLEQCSSEATARYKAGIVQRLGTAAGTPRTLTDLTGGFGIDCSFLAAAFERATYVERQETLCELARHNFPLLPMPPTEVVHADAQQYLQGMSPAGWLFIDPARRDGHGGKTVAIADCEPNVAALEEALVSKAERVLVKLSPMLDLTLALHDLKHVEEAHVLSAGNECKELLLVLNGRLSTAPDEVPVHCVNLTAGGSDTPLCFTRREEREAPCPYTATPDTYLYEPNASLLKAGAFRTVARAYGLRKLHPNSHLYTSERLAAGFPGRCFRVEACCGFAKKEVRALLGDVRKANLTVRNFPASVAELRKKLKLSEGGSTYLFATTLADESKLLLRCMRL